MMITSFHQVISRLVLQRSKRILMLFGRLARWVSLTINGREPRKEHFSSDRPDSRRRCPIRRTIGRLQMDPRFIPVLFFRGDFVCSNRSGLVLHTWSLAR